MSFSKILKKNHTEVLFFIATIFYFGNFFTFFSGTVTILNQDFIENINKNVSFIFLFEFIRSNYSVISLIINLIILIFVFKNNNFKNLKLINISFICLFIPQIIGLANNYLNYKILDKKSFTHEILLISTFINLINIFFLKETKYLKYFYIIPLFCLFIQYIIFFLNYSLWDIQYGGFPIKINVLNETYNFYFNSNGLGRTTCIFYIFSILYFCNTNDLIKKIISLSISTIFLFGILLLAGRFNILCIILVNLIVFLYFNKILIKNWIYILLYIVVVYLALNLFQEYKIKKVFESKYEGKKLEIEIETFKHNNVSTDLLRSYNLTNNSNVINKYYSEKFEKAENYPKGLINFLNNISTGRVMKWIFILDNNDKYILGQGPNMDRRFFLEKLAEITSYYQSIGMEGANDAASGIFYNYIAAGILGTILVIFFFIFILYFGLTKINYKNINYFNQVYICIFLFLTFRVFFEIGYFIHGIDYLLFLIFLLNISIKSEKN